MFCVTISQFWLSLPFSPSTRFPLSFLVSTFSLLHSTPPPTFYLICHPVWTLETPLLFSLLLRDDIFLAPSMVPSWIFNWIWNFGVSQNAECCIECSALLKSQQYIRPNLGIFFYLWLNKSFTQWWVMETDGQNVQSTNWTEIHRETLFFITSREHDRTVCYHRAI